MRKISILAVVIGLIFGIGFLFQNCSGDFDPSAYVEESSNLGSGAGPTIFTGPQNATADTGGSATFSVMANGESLTYQWFKDEVEISGATAAALLLSNIQAGDAGTYRVHVQNQGGAVNASATLTVLAAPTPTPSPTITPTATPTPMPVRASVTVEAEGTCSNGNVTGSGATFGSIDLSVGGSVSDSYTCQYNFMNGGGGNVLGCRVVITVNGQTYTAPSLTATSLNAGGYNFTIQYSPGGSTGVIGSQCIVRY